MQKERILLIGGNYVPEPTGIGKYNGEMMSWLATQGHECSVVTSYPYYPHWKRQAPYEKKSYWFTRETISSSEKSIKVYRCPHYIPKKPTGLKRMISDLTFMFSAFIQVFLLLFKKKYDYVITVVPPFQIGLLGVMYKWIKGAKLIYHIQDLQIDAAKELKMINSKMLLSLMFRIEKFILEKADHRSSISDGMIRKIVAKCGKPVIFFPNWVDTQTFHPITKKEELKLKFNFLPDEKIVLYSGAIGEKQGLESIIYAARDLRGSKVKFVICGSGPYKEKLSAMVQSMALDNVVFLPLQPKEVFNEFLNMADIHLVLQKANANDLVMPSKLTTILSVGGLALITAPRESSLHSIISRHEMGILVEPEDQLALSHSIKEAVEQSFASIKNNARSFAKEYLSINNVINKFMDEIQINRQPAPSVTILRKEKVETDLVSG
jgi:colanic acid biosynthesis glycosyl transferase WcaI